MYLDFNDYNQQRYESTVTAYARHRKLVADARESQNARPAPPAPPARRRPFHAWLSGLQARLVRMAQPAEDPGYIA